MAIKGEDHQVERLHQAPKRRKTEARAVTARPWRSRARYFIVYFDRALIARGGFNPP